MTKLIELRPEKDLLNSRFEKYQFCTDIIPVTFEIDLKEEVYRLELSPNQESLLETRLFAFHNHLFRNPYDDSCWFIDKNWVVWRLKKDSTLEQLHVIHDASADLRNCLYNPSIAFSTNNVAVISDGGNCVKVLIEDDHKCTRVFNLNDVEPGIILDVRYVEETSKVVLATCAITSNGEKKFTKLTVSSYTQVNPRGSECFECIHKEVLRVQGAVEYAQIEENGDYLHSISQDCITFENVKPQESTTGTSDADKKFRANIPKYCWSQDEDSLSVWIKVEKEDEKRVKVSVTPTKLSVVLDDTVLVEGDCQHRLDEDLTTWKYEGDTFRLDLAKSETGLMWSELIKGDTGGECLPNETLATEIHSRLAHLCTDQTDGKLQGEPCIGFNAEQLEECDLEGRDNLLQRFNLVTQENTHLAMLGANNHILFAYKIKSGQLICLRHDHDGCVWLTERSDDHWNMKHVYTFPGFGYVEASKSNKKFCVSPENGSYVAILEHTRHIFLYEKPERNVRISKQWIVDLGCDSCPIMGAVATKKHLIVLTKDKLYSLEIPS